MKRREFLGALAVSASATLMGESQSGQAPGRDGASDSLGAVLPLRPLGKTGDRVTMLGIGGYHVGWTSERDAEEIIEAAIEGGIRFFDTAVAYGKGESETRYGKFLTPKYREHIFLMTKTHHREPKLVQGHLEASLKRMKTDYLDLWQLHSLNSPEDVDTLVGNGVLDVLREARESGKVRHLGFTGHANPEAHLRMLEHSRDLDLFATCQMPVNVIDPNYHSFIEQVIPVLEKRGMGLLAMKTLADGRFFGRKQVMDDLVWESEDPAVPGRVSIAEALHFVWSLPVSVLITGAENADLVREKVGIARSFTKLGTAQRLALVAKVADLADGKVEYYKKPVEA